MVSDSTLDAWIALAAGPAVVGVGGLLLWASRVLADRRRDSTKGWWIICVGCVVCLWSMIFVLLALPVVVGSWVIDGEFNPRLLLLNASWVVSLGVIGVVGWKTPSALRYLLACYRPSDTPAVLRPLRRHFEE